MANKRKRFASGGESSTGDEGIDPISGLPTTASMPEYSSNQRAIRSERPDAAFNNIPTELRNLRYRKNTGLGYEIPIGKDQSLTPSIGKGRVGVTYKMGFKEGGKVGSASKRADGCCSRGKTRGKMV